jgi:hypothetical protein
MAKKRTETSTNVIALPATESSTPALEKATGLTDRDIARRAFEIFSERGCEHGRDVDDWLQAELELTPSVETALA